MTLKDVRVYIKTTRGVEYSYNMACTEEEKESKIW